jgi:hypothetical protein
VHRHLSLKMLIICLYIVTVTAQCLWRLYKRSHERIGVNYGNDFRNQSEETGRTKIVIFGGEGSTA